MSDISVFSKSVSLRDIVDNFVAGRAHGIECDAAAEVVGKIVANFHGYGEPLTGGIFEIVWNDDTKLLQVLSEGKVFTFEPQLVPGEDMESISDRFFKLIDVA